MSFLKRVSLIFLLTLSCTVKGNEDSGEEPRPIYDDCVEAHQKACQGGTDGRYLIKSRTTVGFAETECHSSGGGSIPSGCTGSGWTLIGVVNGNNSNDDTSYNSAIWTAKGNDQTNFNSQFWSANVTEVCLTSDAFSIQFPVQAPSLRSLFFQNNTLNISKDQWIAALEDGITEPAFEENFYETGFNVGDPNHVQARIGIVSIARPNSTAEVNNTERGVRLVGGKCGNEGRVEIYYNSRWGTVCDDRWDLNDARVVCRQLGFQDAEAVFEGGEFGEGTGTILFDEIACAGNESSLFSCGHRGVGVSNCDHDEDAGVRCNITRGPPSQKAIGVGIKFAGKDYGSVHGAVCDNNVGDAYHDVSVYVRSKPLPSPAN